MAKKMASNKKKPVSKSQASAVADMLRKQKSGTSGDGPKMPTPKQNPVTTYDDDADDQGN